MRRYGELPLFMGTLEIDCNELMFYQYLPIKLSGQTEISRESRISVFDELIGKCCCDFIGAFGLNRYVDSNVYITAKHLYQTPGCSFNRGGWHSDGFLTDDINYIWSNNNGCTFNNGEFALSLDHTLSLLEMEDQADCRYNGVVPDNELIRLDQFNIHKVSDILNPCLRTFAKISISKDKYNLLGNSVNSLLDYKWVMKERESQRNHPSK